MRRPSLWILITIALVIVALLLIILWLLKPPVVVLPIASSTPNTHPSKTVQPTFSSLPTHIPTPPALAISDSSHLYSVTFPTGWNIRTEEGKKGVQLSLLTAESPDFVVRVDNTTDGPFMANYFEHGATMTIHAITGSVAQGIHNLGTTGEPITIANITGMLSSQNEPSTMAGRNLEAVINSRGVNYFFSFAYNPQTYPEGRQIFLNILASFTLFSL